jgi:p21-activated kinase 1
MMDSSYPEENNAPAATTKPPRRLQKNKQKPPVAFHNSKSSTLLRRAPSAPTYPSTYTGGHHPPSQAGSAAGVASSLGSLRHRSSHSPVYGSQSSSPLASQASFDNKAPEPAYSATSAPAQHNHHQAQYQQQLTQPPPRPHPLPHSHTTGPPAIKTKSPKLRQSASFSALARSTMETITPPRSDGGGNKSPRQRYSDEADAATKSKNRKSDGGRKKGAFSSFVNSVLGSPRRPTISTPTNPMHVTHVSIDNETGEFTVCARHCCPSILFCLRTLQLLQLLTSPAPA